MKRSLLLGLLVVCLSAIAAPVMQAQAWVIGALNWPGNKVQFFFSDGTYVRYDTAADRADAGYPQHISDSNWPGLGRFSSNIITAFNGLNNKAYFFLDDGTYVRYDIQADHVDSGYPQPVTDQNWPGLGADSRNLMAAVQWNNGKAYFFFKNGTYSRYDLTADRTDPGYPQQITNSNWPGLGPYATAIVAAANWNNGKAYFFLGDGSYLRYDMAADRVDAGYPQPMTQQNWPGLPEIRGTLAPR